MLFILQRYYFESESQQDNGMIFDPSWCCLSYKDTILKANHNQALLSYVLSPDVVYPTKILFWKRITTFRFWCTISLKMLFILQRYYFESESQPSYFLYYFFQRCCLSYKDTILKANHNWNPKGSAYYRMLFILQRYYFESESQQVVSKHYSKGWCCLSYKDTILKANHNGNTLQQYTTRDVVYPTKILFWKRITTRNACHRFRYRMLFILQRYYFESESQRLPVTPIWFGDVVYPTKILFWKRITTIWLTINILIWMLFILQRYYFESESQHVWEYRLWPYWCCLSYKDTILKANHNTKTARFHVLLDVVYPTKILFWKRITTDTRYRKFSIGMLLILQRYYFESESQLGLQPVD